MHYYLFTIIFVIIQIMSLSFFINYMCFLERFIFEYYCELAHLFPNNMKHKEKVFEMKNRLQFIDSDCIIKSW